jgi:hypothetical protein
VPPDRGPAALAASRLPRRLSIVAAAASAVALGAVLVYAAVTAGHGTLAVAAVEGFLPLVAGWFTGDSVAARRRYLAGLAEQAQEEQAAKAERARQQVREERVRIARELHDVVAHTLVVITVQAGVGRRLMAKRPEEAGTALESIENIGRPDLGHPGRPAPVRDRPTTVPGARAVGPARSSRSSPGACPTPNSVLAYESGLVTGPNNSSTTRASPSARPSLTPGWPSPWSGLGAWRMVTRDA